MWVKDRLRISHHVTALQSAIARIWN